jgi:cation diffusion facilitator CzcD-associated flavoprotein CzcO
VGAVELYDYFKRRAKAYGVDEFVRLNHKVTAAMWNEQNGKWSVTIQDFENQKSFIDEAEILINAAGFLKYLSSWNDHTTY